MATHGGHTDGCCEECTANREADLIEEWLNAGDGARVLLSGIGTAYNIADQIKCREHRAWDKRRKEQG